MYVHMELIDLIANVIIVSDISIVKTIDNMIIISSFFFFFDWFGICFNHYGLTHRLQIQSDNHLVDMTYLSNLE